MAASSQTILASCASWCYAPSRQGAIQVWGAEQWELLVLQRSSGLCCHGGWHAMGVTGREGPALHTSMLCSTCYRTRLTPTPPCLGSIN